MSMGSLARRDLLPVAAVASCIVLLIAWRAAGPWDHRAIPPQFVANAKGGDLDAYWRDVMEADLHGRFMPVLDHLRRCAAEGVAPLLNPYQFAGMPLLASHEPAVLYPPLWIAAALEEPHSLNLFLGLHLVLAMVGMFALALRFGVAVEGAAAAMATFACAGVFLYRAYHPWSFAAAAWIPAMAWAAMNLVRRADRRCVAVAASVFALSFLSGRAQMFVYGSYLAAACAIYELLRIRQHPPLDLPRRSRSIFAAAVVFTGLVAAQLLPTIELLTGTGSTWQGAAAGPGLSSLGPISFKTLLTDASGFPIVLWPLAIVAVTHGKFRGAALFLIVTLVASRDFSAGADGWTYAVFEHVPGIRLFRNPGRAGVVGAIAAACLVAQGTSVLCDRARARRTIVMTTVVLAVVLDLLGRAELPGDYPSLAYPSRLEPSPALVEQGRRGAEAGRVYVRSELFTHDQVGRLGLRYGFGMASDYEPLLPGPYARLIGADDVTNWLGDYGLEGASFRGIALRAPLTVPRVLAVSTYLDIRRGHDETVRLDDDHPVPRAFAVHRAVVEPSADRVFERLRRGDFNLKRLVLVAGPVALEKKTGRVREPVIIEDYKPQKVLLRSSCRSTCLVVLTDLDYAGWQATVDGTDSSIINVDGLYRGVIAQASEHEIEFTYRPRSFYVGATASGVTLALLLAALFAQPRYRRDNS